MRHFSLPLAASLLLGLAACAPASQDTETSVAEPEKRLTVYSARHYDSDKLLYAAFEEQAGVTIDVRETNASQLLETMKAEGENSPADVIIASDAGALWRFEDAGLTQAFDADLITADVPASLRHSDNHWIGLAKRIRLVAYDPELVDTANIDQWTDLADEVNRGEICVRSSSNIYNLSLMAEMIDRVGEETASAWAAGVKANMARNPQGGDTDQIRAVAAGQCSIAIVNHYYWARLSQSDSEADRAVAEKTRLIIPSFDDGGGAHVNITGIALSKTSENPDLAAEFVNFLLTKQGQELLTLDTQELPILAEADAPAGAVDVPPYERSDASLDVFGENQAEAQRLYDLAGWN
ncbi:MAG: extracellular solute-binding protein [Henriciella sp.]|nr:extracellular solute-binding protein [Henriciella sp.]